jgi:hypothetical protein
MRMGRDRRGRQEAGDNTKASDLEQQVRERAYERFLARTETGEGGDALSDWLAAEADVAGRRRA